MVLARIRWRSGTTRTRKAIPLTGQKRASSIFHVILWKISFFIQNLNLFCFDICCKCTENVIAPPDCRSGRQELSCPHPSPGAVQFSQVYSTGIHLHLLLLSSIGFSLGKCGLPSLFFHLSSPVYRLLTPDWQEGWTLKSVCLKEPTYLSPLDPVPGCVWGKASPFFPPLAKNDLGSLTGHEELIDGLCIC